MNFSIILVDLSCYTLSLNIIDWICMMKSQRDYMFIKIIILLHSTPTGSYSTCYLFSINIWILRIPLYSDVSFYLLVIFAPTGSYSPCYSFSINIWILRIPHYSNASFYLFKEIIIFIISCELFYNLSRSLMLHILFEHSWLNLYDVIPEGLYVYKNNHLVTFDPNGVVLSLLLIFYKHLNP